MKTAIKSPCYLVRNPYSYCFRMIVPKDLRKFVGKTELRYTLKTGYLGVAKNKAKLLAGQVQLIFSCLRKEHAALSKLLRQQRKIAKKAKPENYCRYFILEMLKVRFKVTPSVKGLDPNLDFEKEDQASRQRYCLSFVWSYPE